MKTTSNKFDNDLREKMKKHNGIPHELEEYIDSIIEKAKGLSTNKKYQLICDEEGKLLKSNMSAEIEHRRTNETEKFINSIKSALENRTLDENND